MNTGSGYGLLYDGTKAHSAAKLHTAMLETHSLADGAHTANVVLNGKVKVLFKIAGDWGNLGIILLNEP